MSRRAQELWGYVPPDPAVDAEAALRAERVAYLESDTERELGATLAREIDLRTAAGLDCTYQRERLRQSPARIAGARIQGLIDA